MVVKFQRSKLPALYNNYQPDLPLPCILKKIKQLSILVYVLPWTILTINSLG